jgi:hypothetical protein
MSSSHSVSAGCRARSLWHEEVGSHSACPWLFTAQPAMVHAQLGHSSWRGRLAELLVCSSSTCSCRTHWAQAAAFTPGCACLVSSASDARRCRSMSRAAIPSDWWSLCTPPIPAAQATSSMVGSSVGDGTLAPHTAHARMRTYVWHDGKHTIAMMFAITYPQEGAHQMPCKHGVAVGVCRAGSRAEGYTWVGAHGRRRQRMLHRSPELASCRGSAAMRQSAGRCPTALPPLP